MELGCDTMPSEYQPAICLSLSYKPFESKAQAYSTERVLLNFKENRRLLTFVLEKLEFWDHMNLKGGWYSFEEFWSIIDINAIFCKYCKYYAIFDL